MPRKQLPERKIGKHSKEDMERASNLIRNGTSIRQVSKDTGLAFATIRRYYEKLKRANYSIESIRLVPHYDINKIFTVGQETALKEYFQHCALLFYGLTTTECRRVAYEMAKINNVNIPTSWQKNKLAGIDWLKSFRRRHQDLSLRKPEPCSLARATAFNKINVTKFFDNLEKVMQRNPAYSDGTRIYNLDETSTTTVQKPHKVLGPRGRKNLGKVTSGEKGTLVTTCCIVSASGQTMPPAMVFPRKKFKLHMTKGAPSGTLGLAAPTGWMNSELFVDVMDHFIKQSHSTPENPSILIMDNHESHLSLEALNRAKYSGVITLHPHTSAKLQPLDVGIFAPFKSYYNSAVDSWLLHHPGQPISIYEIGEIVGIAFLKAMTPINIINAFKKTGIFPFDRNVFTEQDYLPSSVTDRPCAECEVNSPCRILAPCNPDINNIDIQHSDNEESFDVSIASTSSCANQQIDKDASNTSIRSAASDGGKFVTPFEFRKPIKAGPRKNKRKPRKLGRSLIATDTPEKNEIEAEKLTAKKQKTLKRPHVRKVLQDSESEDETEIVLQDSDNDQNWWEEEDDENWMPLTNDMVI